MSTIAEDIVKFYDDPYRFVIYAFPWGVEGGPLAKHTGPDKWQKDLLNTIRDEIRKGNPEAIRMACCTGHGVGKVMSNSILVDTPNGKVNWGDIQVGDYVFGSNGKPTRVTNKFPHKNWDFYRITFSDGTHTFAGLEHKWEVTTQNDRNKKKGSRVVDTEEMMNNLHRSYHVPLCKPVEYESDEENILSPYLVGYLLGNGNFCTYKAVKLSCHEEGHYDYMQTLLPDGCFFSGKAKDYLHISSGYKGNTVVSEIKRLGLNGVGTLDKFVPDQYKYTSSAERLEVLRGLMDSDGTISSRKGDGGRKGYKVQFSTSSKKLRDYVIWIVRSLGGVSNFSTDGRRGNRGKGRDGGEIVMKNDNYEVHINLPNHINPFRLQRKKEMYDDYVSTNKREPLKAVRSIEYDHTGEGHCITVDAADSLYLANDFIVTHNSALTSWLVLWFMSTRPNPQALVTANTMSQLNTKTWRELKKWHNLSINKDWFEHTATKFYLKEQPETWFTAAIPWSEHRSEAFAGMHEENVLVIFDEASGIADSIFEVVEGAMTQEGAFWFVFGNPTQNIGRFRETFRKFKHRWKQFKVDSRTSKMANQAQIEQWKEDYGEDSDFFNIRVKGEFPQRSVTQFISSEVVDKAIENVSPNQKDFPYIIGVDVARSDGDSSVILLRQGRKVIFVKKFNNLNGIQLTNEIAIVAAEYRGATIFIDEIGVGASVVDHCKLLNIKFIGVNSANKSENPMLANKRTEMWFDMREWLANGADIPNNSDLTQELTSIQYTYHSTTDKIILESKKDIRSRQGSPDCADALALTFSQRVLPPKLMLRSNTINKKTDWDVWHT